MLPPVFKRMLVAACVVASLPAFGASLDENALRTLNADGWAGVEGGTVGGARAGSGNVFHVRDIAGLLAAFKRAGTQAKIVVVEGVIDATGGRPFESKADQAARTQIHVPSNTTLVGADRSAGFINANLVLKNIDNVIVRNLNMQNPWDEFPVWDPNDGPAGHWNSEYDGITIDHGTHVWVDHVAFTDAPRTDAQNGSENGQEVQHHDGALDLKKESDFITVSNCVFDQHDKNNLIGHSDKYQQDAGHLRVTFHDNLFRDIIQRAPRVRYGHVHLYNNYYAGTKSHTVYPHMYSIGLGVGSSVISEDNAFDIKGADSICDIVKSYGSVSLADARSLLNGALLKADVSCKGPKGQIVFEAPDWQPPYRYAPVPAAEVAASVQAVAGPR